MSHCTIFRPYSSPLSYSVNQSPPYRKLVIAWVTTSPTISHPTYSPPSSTRISSSTTTIQTTNLSSPMSSSSFSSTQPIQKSPPRKVHALLDRRLAISSHMSTRRPHTHKLLITLIKQRVTSPLMSDFLEVNPVLNYNPLHFCPPLIIAIAQ